MSQQTRPMTDAELDATIAHYLGWRAHQIHGAPGASTVADRLAGQRPAAVSRARRVVALGLAGLLVAAAIGLASLVGRPSTLPGPLAGITVYLVDGLGWHELDPATRELTTVTAPCDGLCPTGTFFSPTSDGQSVFYVETTRIGGDLRPEPPGWSLWRWDRDATVVSRVATCSEPCTIDMLTPSPDGRSIAFVESPGGAPDAPSTVVVVDAMTGAPRWRQDPPGYALPAWDAQGRLILSSIDEPGGTTTTYERIDLVTGRSEAVGADLPGGIILSSPDGTRAMVVLGDPSRTEIQRVDPDLDTARRVLEIDGKGWLYRNAWAPGGSTILAFVLDETTTGGSLGDLRLYDLSTGQVEIVATVTVGQGLLLLPDG